MKKNLSFLFIVFIFLSANAIAQNNLKNSIQLYFTRSFHGTGDLPGVLFTAEYGHYFNRRFEIAGNITSTIHWGSYPLYVNAPYGNFDGSFRYGTAGLQVGSKLGLAILKLTNHHLKFQGGTFIRFQSSSLPNVYGLTYPPATNYPEPVFTFRHDEKQNILTIGYVAELSYAFVSRKNLLLGAKAGFQNDSNADIISYYGLFIGKRFKSDK